MKKNAPLRSRFLALIVDSAMMIQIIFALYCLWFFFGILTYMFITGDNPNIKSPIIDLLGITWIPALLFLLALFFYFVYIPRKSGQTLGQKMTHIRVRGNNGKQLNILQHSIRFCFIFPIFLSIFNIIASINVSLHIFIILIIFIVLLVDSGWYFIDSKKRTVHDLLSQTIVSHE